MGRSLAVVCTALLAFLTACSKASDDGSPWAELPLPAKDARILAFTSIPGGLLALGSVPGPDGRAPAAWTTSDGHQWRSVAVEPHSPYAFQTELISAGIGDRITVLGQAFGGAHSNPRMTVWGGDTTKLVEFPQAFELFGGPHSIAVSAAAALSGTGLLVGQWDGSSHRYGAAVWTSPDNANWQRSADDPALSSAVGEQTAAVGVATGPPGFLVVGNTQRNGEFEPLAWTSRDGATWQRIALQGSGAVAQRAGCGLDHCVLLGQTFGDRPHALCWPTMDSAPVAGLDGPSLDISQVLVPDFRAPLPVGPVAAVIRIDGTAHLVEMNYDCTHWYDLRIPVRAAEARIGALLSGSVLLATTDQAASRLWIRHPPTL
ncbi:MULTISPECIES: hypothetical protein [unclassified Nocardia]|uniref:hypothetical protein n=1 Tax=unclassified Nocardia TaxID=2637762 RepID=UPI001CE482BC|nr:MULTISPECIES: hypothetical protein [unclassified Nocardia]